APRSSSAKAQWTGFLPSCCSRVTWRAKGWSAIPERKTRLPSRRGSLMRLLLIAVIICVLLLAVGAGIAGYWYLGPYRGFENEAFVEIEHGMSSQSIARVLASQGVVRSRWAFLAVRAVHPRATLQAGEYRFGSAQTPF